MPLIEFVSVRAMHGGEAHFAPCSSSLVGGREDAEFVFVGSMSPREQSAKRLFPRRASRVPVAAHFTISAGESVEEKKL
jgi:hypothetical protein